MGMSGIYGQIIRQACAKDPLRKGCDQLGYGAPTQPAPSGVGNLRGVNTGVVAPGGSGGDQIAHQLDTMVTKYGVTPYQALQASNGRYNNPSDPAWWMTYGMGPEHQFFTNNTAPTPPGAGTPAPVTPAPPRGTPTTTPLPVGMSDPRVRIPVTPPRIQAHRRGGPITQLLRYYR